MRMEKRKFRIGELAKCLEVERFVIRFWEKEFKIKTTRSSGGQRFYSEDDLNTFKTIKELLYQKGFTIAGARKQITNPSKPKNEKEFTVTPSQRTVLTNSHSNTQKLHDPLLLLRERLIHLQRLL